MQLLKNSAYNNRAEYSSYLTCLTLNFKIHYGAFDTACCFDTLLRKTKQCFMFFSTPLHETVCISFLLPFIWPPISPYQTLGIFSFSNIRLYSCTVLLSLLLRITLNCLGDYFDKIKAAILCWFNWQ